MVIGLESSGESAAAISCPGQVNPDKITIRKYARQLIVLL
jgi:hypothetical protein